MKKFISTYIIIFIFAGVLSYYFWSEKHQSPPETTIFKFEKGDFQEISLINKWKIVKNKKWKIIEPKKWDADQGKVESIVEKLSSLSAERVVEKEGKDLKKYGLDKPETKLSFSVKGKTYQLLIGKKSPVSYQFYVKKNNSPVIYVLSGYTVDSLNVKSEDLRERRIVKVEKGKVRKLILVSKKKISMEKKGDKWEIISPVKTEGDRWEIEDVIDEIGNLKAKKFIEDKAKDLSIYGLDKPSLKVELYLGKTLSYKSISFGKTKGDIVYAKRSGKDTIYGVNKNVLRKINKNLFTLRNKNMLAFSIDEVKGIEIKYKDKEIKMNKKKDIWKMEKPEKKKVKKEKVEDLLWVIKDLSADSFIEEKEENLEKYGLLKPVLSLKLTLKNREKTLYLGKVSKREKVYAKVSDKPQVFTIGKSIMDDIKEKIKKISEKKDHK